MAKARRKERRGLEQEGAWNGPPCGALRYDVCHKAIQTRVSGNGGVYVCPDFIGGHLMTPSCDQLFVSKKSEFAQFMAFPCLSLLGNILINYRIQW